MPTKSIVVLAGTKEFKQLDTKTNGQLSRAAADLEDGEGVTLAYPTKLDAQYVRIENRKIDNAVDAREFGGEIFSLFKNKVEELHFNLASKFNNDIAEGAELAGYQFTKYKLFKLIK